MIDTSDIEEVIDKCFDEMSSASRDKYDSDKADRTAALFLTAQMKLSSLIEEVELKSKHSKNEISRLEGEKYFEIKESDQNKKITDKMTESYVAKHPDIVEAKREFAVSESNLKKWNYILNTLKDGHIYFRNLGKNKNWSE